MTITVVASARRFCNRFRCDVEDLDDRTRIQAIREKRRLRRIVSTRRDRRAQAQTLEGFK